MAIQKGDYILLDYTIIVKDENRIVQTTNEEKAKEAGIYSPDQVYEPRLVIVGETKLLEPVEEAILKADEGQELTIEVPPEKAFGERDPKKIKTVSIREFQRIGRIPRPGDIVEYEGQQARVIDVSSGRVILDFNHPLAGKTLIVQLKIVKKLDKDEDKIRYIIKQYIPRLKPESIEVNIEDGTVRIKLPLETVFIDRIGLVKASIADEIGKRFPNINKVVFVDEFEIKRQAQQQS
jgi:peptidylprolyl isomerase